MTEAKWFAFGWLARWFVTRARPTATVAPGASASGAVAARGVGEVPGDRDELDAAEVGA